MQHKLRRDPRPCAEHQRRTLAGKPYDDKCWGGWGRAIEHVICQHHAARGQNTTLTTTELASVSTGMLSIRLATVETRRNETSFPVPGVSGWNFTNVGAGEEWIGMNTKVDLYLSWLRDRAQQAPAEVVILADGGDVSFGGCGEEELLARYQAVVAATNVSRIVAGGDNSIWPHTLR